jgi:hypothetical protein
MFLTESVCLPPSTPPVVASVLELYPSYAGQQPSLECTTVQCLGAQLASTIPHGVTSHKTGTFNNLNEVSGPVRQYYSVRRPAAPLCYLRTKMADPEACDSVSAIVITWLTCAQWSSAYIPVRTRLMLWCLAGWWQLQWQEPYLFFEYSATLYQLLDSQRGAEMSMRRQDECMRRDVDGNGSGLFWHISERCSCPCVLHEGSEGMDPLILNQGTRSRWMVSVTPWPLYRREAVPTE